MSEIKKIDLNNGEETNSNTTTASIKYPNIKTNIESINYSSIKKYVDNSVKEFYDKALYENSKTMDIVNDYITVTTQMVNDITDNIEARSDVTNALFNTVIDDISTLTDICDHLNMRMKFNESFYEKILKEIDRIKIIETIIYSILVLMQIFDICLVLKN